MKTVQLFFGGSFVSQGLVAGISLAKRQLTFEEMLLHELGARPVVATGLLNQQPQKGSGAASLDARATQVLWEFWA